MQNEITFDPKSTIVAILFTFFLEPVPATFLHRIVVLDLLFFICEFLNSYLFHFGLRLYLSYRKRSTHRALFVIGFYYIVPTNTRWNIMGSIERSTITLWVAIGVKSSLSLSFRFLKEKKRNFVHKLFWNILCWAVQARKVFVFFLNIIINISSDGKSDDLRNLFRHKWPLWWCLSQRSAFNWKCNINILWASKSQRYNTQWRNFQLSLIILLPIWIILIEIHFIFAKTKRYYDSNSRYRKMWMESTKTYTSIRRDILEIGNKDMWIRSRYLNIVKFNLLANYI